MGCRYSGLEVGERYLYHYTSASTLSLILDSGSLRLGPYSQTRDPRENREWLPTFVPIEPDELWPDDWDMFEVSKTLNQTIRQRAKLICFTLDRETAAIRRALGEGYGRARMWEQYADLHRGAVLVLEREALDWSVAQEMEHKASSLDPCATAMTARIFDHVMHFQVRDTLDMAAAAEDVIKTSNGELFFRKNTDWEGETEYRYVVVSDNAAEFVPIQPSLAAIVVGMDYPTQELSVLRYRLEKLDLAELPVAGLHWLNGLPMPLVLSPV